MLHESLNEVLIECVRAAGGSKVVGFAIWPAKGPEGAQRHMLACLNTDRQEKLSPEETFLIARRAHDKGCHLYAEYLAHEIGYEPPVPAEHEDALLDAIRRNNDLRAAQIASSDRVEKLLKRKLARGEA
jgi:hypothetical protein